MDRALSFSIQISWYQVLSMVSAMRKPLGHLAKKGKMQMPILGLKQQRVFWSSSARTRSTNKNGLIQFNIFYKEPATLKTLGIP